MVVDVVEERRGQRTILWRTSDLESRSKNREKGEQECTKHLFTVLSHVSQVSETE